MTDSAAQQNTPADVPILPTDEHSSAGTGHDTMTAAEQQAWHEAQKEDETPLTGEPRPPDSAASADSQRTRDRACALAWMRGCEQDNDCWSDCYDAALSAVVEDRLDDVERTWATTSTYWKLTHGVSPA